MIGAMLLHLPSASTFSWDIDQLVLWVTILTGLWFFAAEGMFFWLLWRFRARDGVKSRYITGKEPELKRWINIPHTIILVFDIVIIVMAVRVWVKVKQTMPPADDTVRIVTQQWTWSFQHSGPDGVLDTADDVWTSDTLHVAVGKTYHFMLESKDVIHSFFVPVFRLKQDAIPGRCGGRRPRFHRCTRKHQELTEGPWPRSLTLPNTTRLTGTPRRTGSSSTCGPPITR